MTDTISATFHRNNESKLRTPNVYRVPLASDWTNLFSPLSHSSDSLFVTDYFTRTPRKLNAFRSFASVELFHFNVPDDTVVAVWNLITFKEQGGTFGDSCPDRNVTVWVGLDFHPHSLRGIFSMLFRSAKHISAFNNTFFRGLMLMWIVWLCWLATLGQCVPNYTRKRVSLTPWSFAAVSIKRHLLTQQGCQVLETQCGVHQGFINFTCEMTLWLNWVSY